MKVYKLEVMVLDHDEIGAFEVCSALENARFPNRCISPRVIAIDGRDIGEWHDGHPLNFTNKAEAEFKRLFSSPSQSTGDSAAEQKEPE